MEHEPEPEHCECDDRGIPEGFVCGNLKCHRGIEARRSIEQKLGEVLRRREPPHGR